jgi:hypothetical protein
MAIAQIEKLPYTAKAHTTAGGMEECTAVPTDGWT